MNPLHLSSLAFACTLALGACATDSPGSSPGDCANSRCDSGQGDLLPTIATLAVCELGMANTLYCQTPYATNPGGDLDERIKNLEIAVSTSPIVTSEFQTIPDVYDMESDKGFDLAALTWVPGSSVTMRMRGDLELTNSPDLIHFETEGVIVPADGETNFVVGSLLYYPIAVVDMRGTSEALRMTFSETIAGTPFSLDEMVITKTSGVAFGVRTLLIDYPSQVTLTAISNDENQAPSSLTLSGALVLPSQPTIIVVEPDGNVRLATADELRN